MVLEALKANYRVSLLVVRLYPGLTREIPETFRRGCERAVVLDPQPQPVRRFAAWVHHLRHNRGLSLANVFNETRFDVVHIFRLATLPFARRWLANQPQRPRLYLDLDEVDSQTHLRIAALCRANGDLILERVELQLAEQSRAAEEQSYATVDRIYVCSKRDAAFIPGRPGFEVAILPNGVRPTPGLTPAIRTPPYRFLFVGTLGYYPNEDAALFLCRDVAPRLRMATAQPVHVEIVGGGAPARLRQAAADAGVDLMGALPDLRSTYEKTTPCWSRSAREEAPASKFWKPSAMDVPSSAPELAPKASRQPVAETFSSPIHLTISPPSAPD
jgi:hypothetical protein